MLVYTPSPIRIFAIAAKSKSTTWGTPAFTSEPLANDLHDGYEAQVDSTTKTDSPVHFTACATFYERHVEPDTWFQYESKLRDDIWRKKPVTYIKITLNGKQLYEYLDFNQTFKEGHFAFQQTRSGKLRKYSQSRSDGVTRDSCKVVAGEIVRTNAASLCVGKSISRTHSPTDRSTARCYRLDMEARVAPAVRTGDSVGCCRVNGSPVAGLIPH